MFLVAREIGYAVSTSIDTFWLVGAIPATTAISTARYSLFAVAASIATTDRSATTAVSEQATQPASQPTTALTQAQPTHAAVIPTPAPTLKPAPSFIRNL